MLNTPFSPWPKFTQHEADAVSRVLLSNKVNYWTGEECRQFEREFADWTGSKYAIALGNGTLALDVALQALDIGACDEVIVTPRTFIASISSIVNAGATPIFADVDEATGNITAETITAVLSDKTKGIVCVHLAGWPCDMESIMALADEHDLYVIEDCAQAHGARYKGRSVGSIGHIGAWSFCQDKIMTTGGEGGMVTTDSELLWRKMWAYKDHGKSYAAVYETEQSPGYNWLHESFGTNLRMTEMQGVLGRIQLNKMSEWTTKRTANAQAILDACSKWESKGYLLVPRLEHLAQFSNANHAYYKLYVYVQSDNLPDGWTRDRIIEAINNQDVPCFSGSASEVYLEKAFDNTGLRPSIRLPMAKKLGESSLMFLVHPTLTAAEIELTMRAIDSVFGSMVE
ncbi:MULTISPECIES: DegT/DnrJ/EryC1/StrS family aminotransferase [unclassified Psychrobacter]|uniref:DegT/DnrJ/EryC1/StrS family aminotransferase n=1 Tax=unclassified Psychrobacter TaxID=196806 RepID=UPI00086E484F|nr:MULTISPECIES: DegT/DnrJ/EryC1/StrS aminotransferase family protein [unclassified Psychrobacter]MBA6245121.1 DegT/DnrJ/EryC1/StrS aminotransferase family protein [Psychrobacter sp. Urea-trap-18]MBA6286724.1 DegT/DnrJ/EryC1/StrS aminotransferase family protein [Psychrobacter sp. Urea-trap-16]MBA6317817.1 DegT/DnrJ/EryC1/StrS aminotransferase family protein [Psychrobacter sp. Urea-trap-20]MBA6334448.1 DegT/DnrJ/EryC1/StrS aminotransferase family protein [Psychrobacter sp. Urea-trap-19]OEH68463|tara:strand:+ start:65656 stop:66855 length:1200 start_codon:yes stop_codon:yes gene_type:complete